MGIEELSRSCARDRALSSATTGSRDRRARSGSTDPRPRGTALRDAHGSSRAHERVPGAPPRDSASSERSSAADSSRTRGRRGVPRAAGELDRLRSSRTSSSRGQRSAARVGDYETRSRSASAERSSSWRATSPRATSRSRPSSCASCSETRALAHPVRDLERHARAGRLPARRRCHELTPRAIRRIGAQALAAVYASLRKGRPGSHDTGRRAAPRCRARTRRGPFEFGDPLDLDVVRTLLNAVRRDARAPRRDARSSCRCALERRRPRGARARLLDADHDRAAARHELVDVVGGPLPGGEARRARARSPDPHALTRATTSSSSASRRARASSGRASCRRRPGTWATRSRTCRKA